MAITETALQELRETFRSGRTRSGQWRKGQLKALLRLIEENETEIFEALKEDLGKHPAEAFRDEVGILIKSINYALDNLDKWMAMKKVDMPILILPTRGELVPEPLGLVLIFSSWNFPFELALEPLVGALAAGNVAVLKPSDLSQASSSLLAKLIPSYLDPRAVKIVGGGSEVAQELLVHKWDKIFFTGSAKVGRKVMMAAAEHLTPVTLELGGKCPAVFDKLNSSYDLKVAVNRLVGGKWGPCSGQACIAIDYLLVEESFAPTLLNTLKARLKKIYGDKPLESSTISKIVNQHHFQRLTKLLEDPALASKIVHGGSSDQKQRLIEPTIILDPPVDAEIMKEEIFGPLLPIITVKKIEDAIEFINSKPRPLAMYAFTNNETFKKQLVSETSSGTVVFNDAIIQFIIDSLPFGGVGDSGFGRYHGKFSFDTFTHEKVVVRRSFFIEFFFRYPPWNALKMQLIRSAYYFNYYQLALLYLGLKKPRRQYI